MVLVEFGNWELGIGNWELGIGNWELAVDNQVRCTEEHLTPIIIASVLLKLANSQGGVSGGQVIDKERTRKVNCKGGVLNCCGGGILNDSQSNSSKLNECVAA